MLCSLFMRAHCRGPAGLVRVEPAHVDGRPHADVGIVEPQVGDVLVLRMDMTRPPCGHGCRACAEDEVTDRDVVRSQIEYDVYVGLVEPQAQARAVEIEQ